MYLFIYLFIYFCLFRAAPAAYGSFQARGQMGAVAAGLMLQPQQHAIQAVSATDTTVHSNAGSLTH